MIKLMKNSFYKEAETKASLINFIATSGHFSMGEQCATFEKGFSKWQGRKHATFVMNGSMANLILIQALLNMGRLSPGDKVGFSAVTWPTNVMPILQLGLTPIPIDCELETLNVSSKQLLKIIETEKIKVFFITNALGFADDLDEIAKICAARDIILLEDNCESLGSELGNKKLGNFGLASTFSTFVGHHMSTIEGGLICTDDEDLHANMVMCRAHGWDRNLSPAKQQILREKENIDNFYATYTFHELAYNARPTDVQGFLGNCQLPYLNEMISKRQDNFNNFLKAVPLTKVYPLRTNHMNLISNFAMPIICKNKDTFSKYISAFRKAEIEIRPIIAGNMLRQPFYKKHITLSQSLPNADHIHDYGFYFGNNPDLTEDEIDIMAGAIASLSV